MPFAFGTVTGSETPLTTTYPPPSTPPAGALQFTISEVDEPSEVFAAVGSPGDVTSSAEPAYMTMSSKEYALLVVLLYLKKNSPLLAAELPPAVVTTDDF